MPCNAPEMIRGVQDPYNDSDWEKWCTVLKKYNYEQGTKIYQPYVSKYDF